MRVGILLGTLLARAGHEVVFSYARGEQKLKRLAREAQGNARAGTPVCPITSTSRQRRPRRPSCNSRQGSMYR